MSSDDDWTSQLRRGVLELSVLKLLSVRPSHGYELISRLQGLGPLGAGENTVYPLLRRLRRDELLAVETIESAAGPPRQIYRLTAMGLSRMHNLERQWADVVDAIASISKEEK